MSIEASVLAVAVVKSCCVKDCIYEMVVMHVSKIVTAYRHWSAHVCHVSFHIPSVHVAALLYIVAGINLGVLHFTYVLVNN